MSIKLMQLCWDLALPTAAHKLVLLKLCDNANDDGIAYPSVTTISKKVCLSDRHVRRILCDLREFNFIKIEREEDCANRIPMIYRITPDMGVTPDAGVRNPCHGRPQPLTRASATPDAGVKVNHHITINEPSMNHQYNKKGKNEETLPTDKSDNLNHDQQFDLHLDGVSERETTPKHERAKSKTRIREDFEPNQTCLSLAEKHNLIHKLPDLRQRFIDHWLAKGIPMADWQACFRTWLNNHVRFSQTQKQYQQTASRRNVKVI